jgi:hypothetical protein
VVYIDTLGDGIDEKHILTVRLMSLSYAQLAKPHFGDPQGGMNYAMTVRSYLYPSSCHIVRNEMMGLDSMDAVK